MMQLECGSEVEELFFISSNEKKKPPLEVDSYSLNKGTVTETEKKDGTYLYFAEGKWENSLANSVYKWDSHYSTQIIWDMRIIQHDFIFTCGFFNDSSKVLEIEL